MVLTSRVVVLIVHLVAITAVEPEGDPPGAIDVDGPLSLPASFERMKPQARGVEIPNTGRGLKPAQNPSDPRNVVRVQPPSIPGLKEPLQPAVPKTDNHSESVTCNGSPVKQQRYSWNWCKPPPRIRTEMGEGVPGYFLVILRA